MIIFTLLAVRGKATLGNSDDEIELIRRIRKRDANALEELYDLYKRLLFGMVLTIVKKRETAEDILLEIFVTIWNNAESFNEDRGNVYSWIVALARNRAISHIRPQDYETPKNTSASIHEPFNVNVKKSGSFDPLETTIFSNRAELVKRALQEIPEAQRQVIKIAYYRGMTQSEIAGHLNIPPGAVKTRTRKGMLALKRRLEEFIN